MGLSIEYYSGGSWQALSGATVIEIFEELNGKEYMNFTLPNTSSNRSLLSSNIWVRVKWGSTVIWTGIATGIEYSYSDLSCTAYNICYEIMGKRVHSGDYNEVSASTILSDICTSAGVTANISETMARSVRFDRTICLDAGIFIANAVNKDHWGDLDGSNNPRFNVGTKGSNKGSITPLGISSRGIDRSKKRDKVIVRGVSFNGEAIEGSAGSGDDVFVFTEKRAASQATLNTLAQKKLDELNTESSLVSVTVDIGTGYSLYVGDTISISDSRLNLSGSYRIFRTRKKQDIVELEIDSKIPRMSDYIENAYALEDLGIYSISSEQLDNPPGPPNAPTGLTATSKTFGILLKWNSNTEADIAGYFVYKNTTNNSGTATLIASVSANYFYYSALPSEYGVTLYFWVKAYDRVNNVSDFSSVASAKPEAVQPEDLSIEMIPWNSNISFIWDDETPTYNKIWWGAPGAEKTTNAEITFGDGSSYEIAHGYEASLSDGVYYYYWDKDYESGGVFTLQRTTDYSMAVGSGKGLMALVQIKDGQPPDLIPFKGYTPSFGAGVISAFAIRSHHITASEYIEGKKFRTTGATGQPGGAAGIIFDDTGIRTYEGGSSKTLEILAENGHLIIYGKGWVEIKNPSGTTVGYIDGYPYSSIDALVLRSISDKQIVLDANGNTIQVRAGLGSNIIFSDNFGALVPVSSGGVDIGTSSLKWGSVYANDFYGTVRYADIHLSDLKCHKCGAPFMQGDKVKFEVSGFDESKMGPEIRVVPIHSSCLKSSILRYLRGVKAWASRGCKIYR